MPKAAAALVDVAELADAHDLGSCAERRVGSSPIIPTTAPLGNPSNTSSKRRERNRRQSFETDPNTHKRPSLDHRVATPSVGSTSGIGSGGIVSC